MGGAINNIGLLVQGLTNGSTGKVGHRERRKQIKSVQAKNKTATQPIKMMLICFGLRVGKVSANVLMMFHHNAKMFEPASEYIQLNVQRFYYTIGLKWSYSATYVYRVAQVHTRVIL